MLPTYQPYFFQELTVKKYLFIGLISGITNLIQGCKIILTAPVFSIHVRVTCWTFFGLCFYLEYIYICFLLYNTFKIITLTTYLLYRSLRNVVQKWCDLLDFDFQGFLGHEHTCKSVSYQRICSFSLIERCLSQ